MKNILASIDLSIWKPYRSLEGTQLSTYVFEHCKNYGNNSDIYLIVITGSCFKLLPARFQTEVINKPHETVGSLRKMQDADGIIFTITGNIEVGEYTNWKTDDDIIVVDENPTTETLGLKRLMNDQRFYVGGEANQHIR
ncbi:MAG: hypothetical protein WC872_00265 [Candidatus Absconditabacterales bacterium]